MASHTTKHFTQLLVQAGFRITTQRVSILKALAQAQGPQSIDELQTNLPDIDRVTLYRNLATLAKRGVVYQTDFRTGKALFELQDACALHPHHHHIICSECGVTESVGVCVPQQTHTQLVTTSRTFASIESHTLEFFGTCKRCARHA
jgi:Fe2+ or Zn2+ uptake regulation protein